MASISGKSDSLRDNAARVQKTFADAQQLQMTGRHGEAGELYRRILAAVPAHADSVHFLGVATFNQGKADEGLSLIRKSLELSPGNVVFSKNLAALLSACGRLEEAFTAFEQVLSLDPTSVEAHVFLGETFVEREQFAGAVAAFGSALELNSDLHGVRNNLAYALRRQGELPAAAAVLRDALRIEGPDAELYSNFGAVLMELDRLDEAVEACRSAVGVNGNNAAAHNNLAIVLRLQGKLDAAAAAFERALAIDPNYVDAAYALACTLWELEKLDQACAMLRRTISLKSDHAKAHTTLGRVLRLQGKLAEALGEYDKSLAIKPDCVDTHYSRSLALLQAGEFRQGWAEYEWGWRRENCRVPIRDFSQPRWDGNDLAGRRILVNYEQGFGDVIQFARYGPLIADRGGRVVLECQPPLLRLLNTMPGIGEVVAYGRSLPAFDTYCPLMSLPGVFETNLETIPNKVPYLFPEAEHIAAWDERLGRTRQYRVGIVWAGSPQTKTFGRKAVPLELFRPILDVANASFFNLKVDLTDDDIAELSSLGVQNLSPHLTDFAETAAAICNLDLVISVDTAVAHLAGALARPIWVLLPFAADWRWLTDRRDSPWYPTMRLFRQSAPGDWATVIRRVRDALGQELGVRLT